jgi:hypothetical protein
MMFGSVSKSMLVSVSDSRSAVIDFSDQSSLILKSSVRL